VILPAARRSEPAECRLSAVAGVVGCGPERGPERLPLARVVQRRSGVDRHQHLPAGTADLAVVHVAGLAGDWNVPLQEMLGGDFSDSDDEFRVDCRYLPFEIRAAVREFPGPRVAVPGWSAPHAVGDPDVRPGKADCPEFLVQDVAAPADEWLARRVFGLAGRLADEQEVGVGRPGPVDDPAPGGNQVGTPLTPRHSESLHARSVVSRVRSCRTLSVGVILVHAPSYTPTGQRTYRHRPAATTHTRGENQPLYGTAPNPVTIGNTMVNAWIAIGALALVSIIIPLSMMMMSSMLRPSVPEQGKRATYESGEVPTGSSRHIRFNIQYYMVALLFVVFDIETVFIFPWAVIYGDAVGEVGLVRALVPMLVFIGILVVGLAWAWRNGAVEWVRSPRAESQRVDRDI